MAWVAVLVAWPAAAQTFDRPSERRPELEDFESEPTPGVEQRPFLVPPPPPARDDAPLATGITIVVRAFEVEGSSLFSAEELARVTEPWTGRPIDTGALQGAVAAVTSLYVDAGYVSSGAYLPDQAIEAGVVRIQVVEAELVGISIEGDRWLGRRAIERRVWREVSQPLQLADVERALQLLLEEPLVERVEGRLRPGLTRGETLLVLEVEEGFPLELEVGVANDRPPSVGSATGYLGFTHYSVGGHGDTLEGALSVSEGLVDGALRYTAPLTPWGTEWRARFRGSTSKIVEHPFDILNIESDLFSVGVGLGQPVWERPGAQLWIGVMGERRWSRTFLLGEGFAFTPGTSTSGRANVSVLRFAAEWTQRSRRNVVAARSLLSVGLGVLGATENAPGLPDSRYVAWLGQFQWAHRLPETFWNTQLILRTDVQVTEDALFPIEQIAMGGVQTVRGYRENALLRDSGVIASLEIRVPVLRNLIGSDTLFVAPFVDVGHAWDSRERESFARLPKDTLASLGLGLRYEFARRATFFAYWGGRLLDSPLPNPHDSAQDYGFNLGVRFTIF